MLLKVMLRLHSSTSLISLTLLQAAKGVSGLYDATETLLHKVKNSLDRIKIHLTPSTPPTPALFSILTDTLVQLFTILALATKHCDMAVKSDSRLGKVARVLSRRLSELLMQFIAH